MVFLNITTSPIDAVQTVNDLTIINGVPLLSVSILTMIVLIVFFRSKGQEGVWRALAAASWFGTVIGLGLAYVDLLPDQILMFMIAISIGSMVGLFWKRGK